MDMYTGNYSPGANIAVLCIVCVCITLRTEKSGLEIIN